MAASGATTMCNGTASPTAAHSTTGGTPFSPHFIAHKAPNGANRDTPRTLRCNAYAVGMIAYINYSLIQLNNFSPRPEIGCHRSSGATAFNGETAGHTLVGAADLILHFWRPARPEPQAPVMKTSLFALPAKSAKRARPRFGGGANRASANRTNASRPDHRAAPRSGPR